MGRVCCCGLSLCVLPTYVCRWGGQSWPDSSGRRQNRRGGAAPRAWVPRAPVNLPWMGRRRQMGPWEQKREDKGGGKGEGKEAREKGGCNHPCPLASPPPSVFVSQRNSVVLLSSCCNRDSNRDSYFTFVTVTATVTARRKFCSTWCNRDGHLACDVARPSAVQVSRLWLPMLLASRHVATKRTSPAPLVVYTATVAPQLRRPATAPVATAGRGQ